MSYIVKGNCHMHTLHMSSKVSPVVSPAFQSTVYTFPPKHCLHKHAQYFVAMSTPYSLILDIYVAITIESYGGMIQIIHLKGGRRLNLEYRYRCCI